MSIQILNTQITTANEMGLPDQALTKLGGSLDNGEELGLGVFEVDYKVLATNKAGESQEFNITFQPAERHSNIEAYAGWEMESSAEYDESYELIEFLGSEEEFDQLLEDSEKHSKAHLRYLLED